MTGRLARFLKLERRRKGEALASPDAESRAQEAQSRFLGLKGPPPDRDQSAEPAASPSPRFDPSPLPEDPEGEVLLAPLGSGTQPFVRCPRCESDNTVYVQSCVQCGSDLSGVETRAFNERLWRQRTEAAASEAGLLAERQRSQQEASAAEREARRQMAVEMAEQVKRRVESEWETGRWSQGRVGLVSLFQALKRLFRSQR